MASLEFTVNKEVGDAFDEFIDESKLNEHSYDSSLPWFDLFKKWVEVFKEDDDVTVMIKPSTPAIKIMTSDQLKAQALRALLPPSKIFYNNRTSVIMDILVEVDPSCSEISIKHAFTHAFVNNPGVVDRTYWFNFE